MANENEEGEYLINSDNFEFHDLIEGDCFDRSNSNIALVERYNANIRDNQIYANFDQRQIRVDFREYGNLKNGDIVIYRFNEFKVILYSGKDDFVAFDYEEYKELDEFEPSDTSHAWELGANIITIIHPKTEKARKALLYYYSDKDSFESVISECWKDFCKDFEESGYNYFSEYLNENLNFPVLNDEEVDKCANKLTDLTDLDKICTSFIECNWIVYRNIIYRNYQLDALIVDREKTPRYSIVSKSLDSAKAAFHETTVLILKNKKIYDCTSGCEFTSYEIPECTSEPTKADLKKVIEEKNVALERAQTENKQLSKTNAAQELTISCQGDRIRDLEKNNHLEKKIDNLKASVTYEIKQSRQEMHNRFDEVSSKIDSISNEMKALRTDCDKKWVNAATDERNSLLSELAQKISILADSVASHDEKLLETAKNKMAELFGKRWNMLSDNSRKCITTTYMLFSQSKSSTWRDVDYGIIVFPAYKAFENEITKWFCINFENYLKNDRKIDPKDYPSWLSIKKKHYTMGNVPYALCFYEKADCPTGRVTASEKLLLGYVKFKWASSWKIKRLDEIKRILAKQNYKKSIYLKDREDKGKATTDDYLLELLRNIAQQIIPIVKNRNTTDHIKSISQEESQAFLKGLFGEDFLINCDILSGAIKAVLEFIFPDVENN